MKPEEQVGTFLLWGPKVSIDLVRKLMMILPESRPEDIVEIPNEDNPSDEVLGIRCSSY